MHEFDKYEEDEYYEPTIADEIMTEAIDKFKNALVKGKQTAAENLKVWEASLSKREQALVDNKKEFRKREYDIKSKERSLESDKERLERDFYKTKLLDLSEKIQNDLFECLYSINYRYKKAEKCNRCNDKRKVMATRPDRTEVEVDCSCNVSSKEFYIEEVKCASIRINKNKGFTFSLKYDNSTYEDYITIDTDEIFKSVESMSEEKKAKKNDYCIYFTTREEAQKYIDEVLS